MFQLIRALHLDSDWYLGKRYMKREANGIYSMIIFQGQDTDFHPEQCQLKKNLFNGFFVCCSLKVTGISEDQLLVTVLPGLPTTAEIFIVPEKRSRHGDTDEKWAHLDQVASPQIILTVPDAQ